MPKMPYNSYVDGNIPQSADVLKTRPPIYNSVHKNSSNNKGVISYCAQKKTTTTSPINNSATMPHASVSDGNSNVELVCEKPKINSAKSYHSSSPTELDGFSTQQATTMPVSWTEQRSRAEENSSEHSYRVDQDYMSVLSSNNGDEANVKVAADRNNCMQAENKTINDEKTIGGGGEPPVVSILKEGSKENLLQNNNIEYMDPNDGLGPLPMKWETAYTERGELYFIDHNTGTSHWLDPRLSKFQKKSLEDCCEDELPYGWEKIEDALYGTYYIDHVNRRTQYENPVLEAKRRAMEQKEKTQTNGTEMPEQQQQQQQQQHSASPALELNSNHNHKKQEPQAALQLNEPCISSDLQSTRSSPQNSGNEIIENTTMLPYKFTRNPAELLGERIITTLVKTPRGLGITIIGGNMDEFLQIKTIIPNGPAWLDGKLQTGDVLINVNDTCVLGLTHVELVNIFQLVQPGQRVTLEVCRGYPLLFNTNDPNTEIVTTFAVNNNNKFSTLEKRRPMLTDIDLDNNYNYNDIQTTKEVTNAESNGLQRDFKLDLRNQFEIKRATVVKGSMGFPFIIADSALGQRISQILDRSSYNQLQEGDIILEINNIDVQNMPHATVEQVLADCQENIPTMLRIQRKIAGIFQPTDFNVISGYNSKNHSINNTNFNGNGLFRSKTPTADLYSTQPKEVLPSRPKTPVVDTRYDRLRSLQDGNIIADCNANESNLQNNPSFCYAARESQDQLNCAPKDHSMISAHELAPYKNLDTKALHHISEVLSELKLSNGCGEDRLKSQTNSLTDHRSGQHFEGEYENQDYINSVSQIGMSADYNGIYKTAIHDYAEVKNMNGMVNEIYPASNQIYQRLPHPHHESCYCSECQDTRRKRLHLSPMQQTSETLQRISPAPARNAYQHPRSFFVTNTTSTSYSSNANSTLHAAHVQNERMQKRVNELMNDRRYLSNCDSAAGSQMQHLQQARHQEQYPTRNDYDLSLNPTYDCAEDQPLTTNSDCRSGQSKGIILDVADNANQYELIEVTLQRRALGFGFRIVGGTEEGSQVSVGHIVAGGAAECNGRMQTGDEILSVDGNNVVNSSHHKVVSLVGESALRGQVTMILRRKVHSNPQSVKSIDSQQYSRPYPYDVIVSRQENEGFGFVIRSPSNQHYGSTIGELIPNSPADRCGKLNIGDRIIAVNRIDIAELAHGDIVSLIKESGLHVRLTIGPPINEEILSGNYVENSAFPILHNLVGAPQFSENSQLPLPNQHEFLKSEHQYSSKFNYADRKNNFAPLTMNQQL